MSVFIDRSEGRFSAGSSKSGGKEKKRRTGRTWRVLVALFLLCISGYLIGSYSRIPFIKDTREMLIQTAWETMRHRWIAKVFPPSVYKPVIQRLEDARRQQIGWNTDEEIAGKNPDEILDDDFVIYGEDIDWIHSIDESKLDPELRDLPPEQRFFYTLFYELDRSTMEDYLAEHPSVLDNGYEHIEINEAGLNDKGTSIRTKDGEMVLAIDTDHRILLLQVDCKGSRGILAIVKDASMLHLRPSQKLPNAGQYAGVIAENNGALLSMSGSGFEDEGRVGNGGTIAGYAMCDGVSYGTHYSARMTGYKRIELHENNWFYVEDAHTECGKGTTDCVEFSPALVVNGERLPPGIWTGKNPRACIGQSRRSEILMLVVEGRRGMDLGCSVEICADVLLQHDAITAMNMDGGSTAIMWYKGEYITYCRNGNSQGRTLPNAWCVIP